MWLGQMTDSLGHFVWSCYVENGKFISCNEKSLKMDIVEDGGKPCGGVGQEIKEI